MKRNIQILLILAVLAPLAGFAHEETLEERKKRITRKYMRALANMSQSDLLVPEDAPEDARITDSKHFDEIDVGINRQDTLSTMPAPPPPRRAAPQRKNRNWLLDDTETMEDPFADPYADLYVDPYASATQDQDKQETRRSAWGFGEETSPYGERRRDSRYSDPRGDSSDLMGGQRDSRSLSSDRYSPSGFSSDGNRADLFGQKQEFDQQKEPKPLGSTLNSTEGKRSYGSSPETGLLQMPFSRKRNDSSSENSYGTQQTRGHMPYKSPYQMQREQRQFQGTRPEPVQEFKRINPQQKWQDRNRKKTWDPMNDDAFINEMMQKNRR